MAKMVDLRGVPLTAEIIQDACLDLERESERFRREGYRVVFPAWLLRAAGTKLDPSIPDAAMVQMVEHGPMVIYLPRKSDGYRRQ